MADRTSTIDLNKIGNTLKTWLPVVLTLSGLIGGYYLFKADTAHQFELVRRDIAEIREDNQRVERLEERASSLESQLQNNREINIRRELMLKFLIQDAERRGVNIPNLD